MILFTLSPIIKVWLQHSHYYIFQQFIVTKNGIDPEFEKTIRPDLTISSDFSNFNKPVYQQFVILR